MKRENAIYSNSRLYRQASEGSEKLYRILEEDKNIFGNPLLLLYENNDIYIESIDKLKEVINEVESRLKSLCQSISPFISIPILLQSISNFYYGTWNTRPAWLGTALKLAVTYIWNNQSRRSTNSLNSLVEIVKMAGILDQLNNAFIVSEVSGEISIKIMRDEILLSESTQRTVHEFSLSFKSRGKIQRTIRESIEAIWSQQQLALDAIQNIIKGENPSDQDAFKNTIFSRIPREPLGFWAGLWTRLALYAIVSETRKQVTDEAVGIAVIEESGILVPEALHSGNIQAEISKIFWKKEWFSTRKREEWLANMVVERPLIRISSSPALFVSSSVMLLDSLNFFVESSIMRYPHVGGVALPEMVFREQISEPFERHIINLLNKYNFIAGQVNEKGTWKNDAEQIMLTHKQGKKVPGEIDVLAYNKAKNILLVFECKVLGMPYSRKKMKNIVGKIGEYDTEGFHRNLEDKMEWLNKTEFVLEHGVQEIIGAIMLDNRIPGMLRGKNLVLDLYRLEEFLRVEF